MDAAAEQFSKMGAGKSSFFQHVFNFDTDSKNEIMNIIQYAVLAVIPVVVVNKSLQKFVPEADEDKGSFEISAEVLAQTIIMFLGIMLINRIITYIPTYSGTDYVNLSVTNIVLAILIITLSLQTKLGEKVAILTDRVISFWNGGDTKKNKSNQQQNETIRVSQPISQQQQQHSYYEGATPISSLPMQQPNQQFQEQTEPMAANTMGGAFGSIFG